MLISTDLIGGLNVNSPYLSVHGAGCIKPKPSGSLHCEATT
uniref:Uncharacterized protein n=1 Tax=Rhizophora mucronata TaxID=61149 RepID=A0A2P2PJF6_RHIMU